MKSCVSSSFYWCMGTKGLSLQNHLPLLCNSTKQRYKCNEILIGCRFSPSLIVLSDFEDQYLSSLRSALSNAWNRRTLLMTLKWSTLFIALKHHCWDGDKNYKDYQNQPSYIQEFLMRNFDNVVWSHQQSTTADLRNIELLLPVSHISLSVSSDTGAFSSVRDLVTSVSICAACFTPLHSFL